MVRDVRQPTLAASPNRHSPSSSQLKPVPSGSRIPRPRSVLGELSTQNTPPSQSVTTSKPKPKATTSQAARVPVSRPLPSPRLDSSLSKSASMPPRRPKDAAAKPIRGLGAAGGGSPFGNTEETRIWDVAPPSDLPSSSVFGDDDTIDSGTMPAARRAGQGVPGAGRLMTPANSQLASTVTRAVPQGRLPTPEQSQIAISQPGPSSQPFARARNSLSPPLRRQPPSSSGSDDDSDAYIPPTQSRKRPKLAKSTSKPVARRASAPQATQKRARPSSPVQKRPTKTKTPATARRARQTTPSARSRLKTPVTPAVETREFRRSLTPGVRKLLSSSVQVGYLDKPLEPEPGDDPLLLRPRIRPPGGPATERPAAKRARINVGKRPATEPRRGDADAVREVDSDDEMANDTFRQLLERRGAARAVPSTLSHVQRLSLALQDNQAAPGSPVANPDSPFVPRRLASPIDNDRPLSSLSRFVSTQRSPSPDLAAASVQLRVPEVVISQPADAPSSPPPAFRFAPDDYSSPPPDFNMDFGGFSDDEPQEIAQDFGEPAAQVESASPSRSRHSSRAPSIVATEVSEARSRAHSVAASDAASRTSRASSIAVTEISESRSRANSVAAGEVASRSSRTSSIAPIEINDGRTSRAPSVLANGLNDEPETSTPRRCVIDAVEIPSTRDSLVKFGRRGSSFARELEGSPAPSLHLAELSSEPPSSPPLQRGWVNTREDADATPKATKTWSRGPTPNLIDMDVSIAVNGTARSRSASIAPTHEHAEELFDAEGDTVQEVTLDTEDDTVQEESLEVDDDTVLQQSLDTTIIPEGASRSQAVDEPSEEGCLEDVPPSPFLHAEVPAAVDVDEPFDAEGDTVLDTSADDLLGPAPITQHAPPTQAADESVDAEGDTVLDDSIEQHDSLVITAEAGSAVVNEQSLHAEEEYFNADAETDLESEDDLLGESHSPNATGATPSEAPVAALDASNVESRGPSVVEEDESFDAEGVTVLDESTEDVPVEPTVLEIETPPMPTAVSVAEDMAREDPAETEESFDAEGDTELLDESAESAPTAASVIAEQSSTFVELPSAFTGESERHTQSFYASESLVSAEARLSAPREELPMTTHPVALGLEDILDLGAFDEAPFQLRNDEAVPAPLPPSVTAPTAQHNFDDLFEHDSSDVEEIDASADTIVILSDSEDGNDQPEASGDVVEQAAENAPDHEEELRQIQYTPPRYGIADVVQAALSAGMVIDNEDVVPQGASAAQSQAPEQIGESQAEVEEELPLAMASQPPVEEEVAEPSPTLLENNMTTDAQLPAEAPASVRPQRESTPEGVTAQEASLPAEEHLEEPKERTASPEPELPARLRRKMHAGSTPVRISVPTPPPLASPTPAMAVLAATPPRRSSRLTRGSMEPQSPLPPIAFESPVRRSPRLASLSPAIRSPRLSRASIVTPASLQIFHASTSALTAGPEAIAAIENISPAKAALSSPIKAALATPTRKSRAPTVNFSPIALPLRSPLVEANRQYSEEPSLSDSTSSGGSVQEAPTPPGGSPDLSGGSPPRELLVQLAAHTSSPRQAQPSPTPVGIRASEAMTPAFETSWLAPIAEDVFPLPAEIPAEPSSDAEDAAQHATPEPTNAWDFTAAEITFNAEDTTNAFDGHRFAGPAWDVTRIAAPSSPMERPTARLSSVDLPSSPLRPTVGEDTLRARSCVPAIPGQTARSSSRLQSRELSRGPREVAPAEREATLTTVVAPSQSRQSSQLPGLEEQAETRESGAESQGDADIDGHDSGCEAEDEAADEGIEEQEEGDEEADDVLSEGDYIRRAQAEGKIFLKVVAKGVVKVEPEDPDEQRQPAEEEQAPSMPNGHAAAAPTGQGHERTPTRSATYTSPAPAEAGPSSRPYDWVPSPYLYRDTDQSLDRPAGQRAAAVSERIANLESTLQRRLTQARPAIPSTLSREIVPSPQQSHASSPRSLREELAAAVEDSELVATAGAGDEEDRDDSFHSVVEVSSMNPRAAARAVAILKMNHKYIEHGELPDVTRRSSRHRSVPESSFRTPRPEKSYREADATQVTSREELLHEAELELSRRARSRSHAPTVSETPLAIPGAWRRTPKRKRREATVETTSTNPHGWSKTDWRALQKAYRSVRATLASERATRPMPSRSWTPFKRGPKQPEIEWDDSRVVDEYVAMKGLEEQDLVGDWSRMAITLRVQAIARTTKWKDNAEKPEQEEREPKRQRLEEAPSTIKRVLSWVWGSKKKEEHVEAGTPEKEHTNIDKGHATPRPRPLPRADSPSAAFLRRDQEDFDIADVTMAQTPTRPVTRPAADQQVTLENLQRVTMEHNLRERSRTRAFSPAHRSPSAPPPETAHMRQSRSRSASPVRSRSTSPVSPPAPTLQETEYSFGSSRSLYPPLYPSLPERSATLLPIMGTPRPAKRLRSVSDAGNSTFNASMSTISAADSTLDVDVSTLNPLAPLARPGSRGSVRELVHGFEATRALDLSFESKRREKEKASLAGLGRVRSVVERLREEERSVSR